MKDPFKSREAEKYERPIASREFIIEHLRGRSGPATFKELCRELNLFDDEQTFALKKRLRAMERDGQVVFTKHKRYGLPELMDLERGRVIGHKDGYGFLQLESNEKDLFISASEMMGVIHGDEVLALPLGQDSRGRREARIVRVVKPRKGKIVGRYFAEHGLAGIIPDDKRITQEIFVAAEDRMGAKNGQLVVVDLIKRPTKRSNPVGRVVEVLGEPNAPGMEIEVAMRNFDLPHQWPKAVDEEMKAFGTEVPEQAKQDRVDLRDLPLVTIDGEDARDFDDAVYCQPKKSGGWRLYVAIADVSYYVRPGTALDQEATDRGNSVYFPSQVIPMLPEGLSNGLCSLNPEVDRLCMVCEMTISATGKLSGYKFYQAVMRSQVRFTYTKVAAILDGDPELCAQYADQVEDLTHLYSLYQTMKNVRSERGAIEFETEETQFIFNSQRKIDKIVPLVRNDAHKIIEECMILANISAAKFLLKHKRAGLYRIHDKPSEEKLTNFRSFLGELGIESGIHDEAEPKQYSELLNRIADRPDSELIQVMLLRSMRQAVYDHINIGHFGLALEAYAHFTSPIRRYPDLVVHRAIKAILLEQKAIAKDCGAYEYQEEQVDELGAHCSMTDRRADEASRDVNDWLKCEYMQDHLGDTFEGIVSSVTSFGFFVRLNDLHIDGLVHISSLQSDYYHYDDKHQRLVGERSNRQFRLGDEVSIQVVAIKLDERKLDFVLTGDAKKIKGNKGRGSAAKTKLSERAGGREYSGKKGHRGQGVERESEKRANRKRKTTAVKKKAAKKKSGKRDSAAKSKRR